MTNTALFSSNNPIRVVVTDDSAVVRGLLTRVLEEDPAIKVVASANNGEQAVTVAEKHIPDILILDIEMPVMDGITALPKILRAAPNTKVLMCSTLSLRNADITLKALSLGAIDAIAKPTAAGNIISSEGDFKANLINMIKNIATSARKARPQTATGVSPTQRAPLPQNPNEPIPFGKSQTIILRDLNTAYRGKPAILAVGSSTGGPPALFKFLAPLKGIDIPIVITQHMPATFTAMLAAHIQTNTGLMASEAKEGDVLNPGHVYIAPGGYHMTIKMEDNKPTVRLNQDAPENFCRPAVDPMMRSLISAYGNKVLGVILTGMGSDGFLSGRALVDAGGRLFAQDEASSVVWGMPGAVATGGLCHAVASIDELGPLVHRTIMKR
jgi:two-component system chemotaxis response regulator CheB